MKSANLDLLRTIAVALVVLSHLGVNAGWSQQQVLNVEAVGRVGVGIFFVHTTLVLMQSLGRQNDGALVFFVRRIFRIYPLAIFTVLLAVAMNEAGGTRLDLGMIVSNLLLIQNITGHDSVIGPLWSLPYELQMYLFLPGLYAITTLPRPVASIAAVWLVCLAIASTGVFPLLVYAPCFVAGVVAYTLRGRRLTLHPMTLFAAVAAAVLAIGMLEAMGIREEPLLWAMCLVLGLMVPFTKEIKPGWLARASSFVAKYSYSVYLMHIFALMCIGLFPGPVAFQLLVAAAALVMDVRVAYRWVEAPGMEWGRRIAQRIAKRKINPAAEPTGA
jgi:peptidoglycan/LPS O-acetylase OafA/YrhL